MRALILAAGYGTRLGELTKNQPKPLIEVGGKSVIEQIIENLHLHGTTEIIVNLHYLPTVMSEKITNKALFYYEPKLLGHTGTIWALKSWLETDNFFVINGDTISNINYSHMQSRHIPGTILSAMVEFRCIGTWIYPRNYFSSGGIIEEKQYRPKGLVFHDIGTPERLEEARKYYE